MSGPATPRWRSLRWRLPLLLALPSTALAVAAMLGLYADADRRLDRSLDRRAEGIARLVQAAVETAASPEDLRRFVVRVGEDSEARVVVIAAGRPARVIAASRVEWNDRLLTDLPAAVAGEALSNALERGGTYRTFHESLQRFDYGTSLRRPLPWGPATSAPEAAAVVLQLDTAPRQADLLGSMYGWMAFTLAATLAVLALAHVALQRMLIRPLARLGDAVRGGHERDDAAWTLADHDDELGLLARSLRESILCRTQSEAAQRLSERLASVGSLAGGVAHEINTPLQFVNDSVYFLRDATEDLLGAATAARRAVALPRDSAPAVVRAALDDVAAALDVADLDYLAERVPEALSRSEDGVARVRSIVHSLQACADGTSHALQPEDLNRTVQNAVTVVERTCLPLTLIAVDFAALPEVVCHAGNIYDAVLQLLHNAIEAVARRHGRAAPGALPAGRISVRTWRDGGEAVVEITDNGDGIADDIASRVFDPFFTTKAVGLGRGQGLAVAWRVVSDTHGGRLTFSRGADGGTTFTIRLPIHGPALSRSDAA